MAKTLNDTAEATVKDYSDGKDGSTEVKVEYPYEWQELETKQELEEKYSFADLIKLANQRIKATANSAARQKAVGPYAIDPNAPAAIRERMIKDAMKLGKTEAQATSFVDSLLQ